MLQAQASGAMAPKKLTALQEQLQKAEEHYYKVSDKVGPIQITTPVWI